MTEYFDVHKDWNPNGHFGETTKSFTLEQLTTMAESLGEDIRSEEFTYFLTSLTNDTYADQVEDTIRDVSYCVENFDNQPGADYVECMLYRLERDPYYQTCWTVFRLWNLNLDKEKCWEEWLETTTSMITVPEDWSELCDS